MWKLRRNLANHRQGVSVLPDRTNPAMRKRAPRDGHLGSLETLKDTSKE
jgi:hypothetical protein